MKRLVLGSLITLGLALSVGVATGPSRAIDSPDNPEASSTSAAQSPGDGADAQIALWKVPFDSGEHTPVVAGDTIYIPSRHGTLHAFDAETGELEWSFPDSNSPVTKQPEVIRSEKDDLVSGLAAVLSKITDAEPEPGVVGSPLLHEDRLYVLARDFKLYAFEAATRDLQWSFEAGRPILDQAIIRDRTVFLIAGHRWDAHVVYALQADDGSTRWSYEHEAPIRGLTLDDDLLVFTTRKPPAQGEAVNEPTEVSLRGVDADSGEERWVFASEVLKHQLEGPTAAGDHVYFTTRKPNMVSVAEAAKSSSDPKRRKRARRLAKRGRSDLMVEFSHTVSLHAVDASTGTKRWQFDSATVEEPGHVFSPPLVGDAVVIFASEETGVHAVDRTSGELAWRFDGDIAPHGMHLGEHLYVIRGGAGKDTLAALDIETGKIAWSGLSRRNLWIRTVIGDVVFASHGYDGHALSAVDSSNGQVLWTLETGVNDPCAGPVEHDGRVILGTGMSWKWGSEPEHGHLYSIDAETGGLD